MSDNADWTLSINKRKTKSRIIKLASVGKNFTKGILATLPFVLVGALTGLYVTINHLHEQSRESFSYAPDTQAEALASDSEHFSMWSINFVDEELSSEDMLEDLRNNVLYTPAGGEWVWWAIYYEQAHARITHDGVDHVSYHQIAREALNRLEGSDLMHFIGSLGDTMPDHTYSSGIPERLRVPAKHRLNFTHQEMSIIRACESQLRRQYEEGTWATIHYTGYLTFGRLWPQPCNLRARISLQP